MFPKSALFRVEKRINTFSRKGYEYGLSVSFDCGNFWTFETFEKEPTKEQINREVNKFIRCCNIFQENIKVPSFSLETEVRKDIINRE